MASGSDGRKNIRKIYDEAEPIAPDGFDDGPAGDGPRGRRSDGPPWILPDDSPVTPLGINGDLYFYLDAKRQMRDVKDKDHSRLKIMSLFGNKTGYLYDVWPRLTGINKGKTDEQWLVTGWQPEAAAEALMQACADRGVWDVFGRVRGPGCWREDDGTLVFHCGDTIWISPTVRKDPGTISGRYVYPAAAAIARPAEDETALLDESAGEKVLQLLLNWNWKRGDTDARLLLGWIVAAIAGGALKWRPLAWITGGTGTGKSTLHDIIKHLLGEAIVNSGNATAAGVWQVVGHSSLPVAIDELEAGEDNRRANAIVELAREAASGSVLLRGGQDHVGTQFTARSCFLFSSISIPPLLSQDISRMAILELGKLGSTTPPALSGDKAALMKLGRMLRRRLADSWERFDELLETYRQQLASAGHNARGADQFGTLLACADLVLSDAAPDYEVLHGWTEKLGPEMLRAQTDDAPDEERCINHLLTTPADLWRSGAKSPIARYVRRCGPGGGGDMGLDLQEAQNVLADLGLRVLDLDGETWLCVANTHQGLAKVFAGEKWAARSGAGGGWRQALLRLDGARPLSDFRGRDGQPRQNMRFGSTACRAICIPYKVAIPDDDA